MGVNKLWEILESCKKTVPLNHLQNKRLCVDLSCWIVQLHSVSRRHHINGDKPFLRGLFHRLRALIALNCTIILVADGSIPALKLSTYRKRLGSTGDNVQDEATLERKTSLKRNLGSEFSRMIKDAKDLGISLGIPCLDGIEEAEAQCALLNSCGFSDGCFTADSDVFLFGARTVYRDIYLGEGGYVICYEMNEIESKLGFGRNSLITLALLLGGDYSQKVHGIGQETACQLVKSIGEENILQQTMSQGLAFAKKKDVGKSSDKSLIANVSMEDKQCWDMKNMDERQNPKLDEHSQSVINAYLRPNCHSPESVEVQRVLGQLHFQRDQLHLLCAQSFGWPPDKTDEYILPKIAERDLRRLANLRAISYDLGIQAPMPRLPVGYRVASILKHRKLNGVECFEVSWGGEPKVRPSIVPASVLRSACPEMLSDFASKGAKKQNPCKARRKQSENEKLVLDEVETQLKDLVLHGEYQSIDMNGANSCIIDLSTPSPPIHMHKHGACKSNVLQVDVIDLSESDEERPLTDHERRGRELRTFLASIKEDLSS
ncbi:single-strand DNA endonuclease 1 isoform X2 [Nymphaea colorata]|uniref:single-strand DNA endonuclease 1 isoform X2 n=1 Tax=Nymphaea colorata TaxID=210225 RepID=UPI00129E4C99|nr:single-strand DNA endonuclease 1 isoform X2 [Nymphaea colorata]